MRSLARALVGTAMCLASAMSLVACSGAATPLGPAPELTRSANLPATTGPPTGTTAPGTTITGSAPIGPYPTDIPDVAKANTTEGAVAFVTYYMEQVNAAHTGPKPGLLPPLAQAGCKACKGVEAVIVYLADHGQRYDQPAVAMKQVAPDADDGLISGVRIIDAIGHQNAARVVDATGAVIGTTPTKDIMLVFTVAYSDGRWFVNEYQTGT